MKNLLTDKTHKCYDACEVLIAYGVDDDSLKKRKLPQEQVLGLQPNAKLSGQGQWFRHTPGESHRLAIEEATYPVIG